MKPKAIVSLLAHVFARLVATTCNNFELFVSLVIGQSDNSGFGLTTLALNAQLQLARSSSCCLFAGVTRHGSRHSSFCAASVPSVYDVTQGRG